MSDPKNDSKKYQAAPFEGYIFKDHFHQADKKENSQMTALKTELAPEPIIGSNKYFGDIAVVPMNEMKHEGIPFKINTQFP